MKLIEQINIFYKLAIDEQEQKYKKILTKLKVLDIRDIVLVINNYHNKPYFKLEDFYDRIMELVDEGHLNLVIGYLDRNLNYFKQELVNHILDRYLNESQFFIVEDYLPYEIDGVSENLLRKAQMKVIKSIDSMLNSENATGKTEGESMLRDLLKNSTKFSKSLLTQLIKHFGIETYINVMSPWSPENSFASLMKKPKLNKYDIGLLFYTLIRTISSNTLLKIAQKADEHAFEYMRGFLYEDAAHIRHANALMMMSEDTTPMDINYNQVFWPNEVRIITLNEIKNPQLKAKWAEVFANFKIIAS